MQCFRAIMSDSGAQDGVDRGKRAAEKSGLGVTVVIQGGGDSSWLVREPIEPARGFTKPDSIGLRKQTGSLE